MLISFTFQVSESGSGGWGWGCSSARLVLEVYTNDENQTHRGADAGELGPKPGNVGPKTERQSAGMWNLAQVL